MDSGLRIESIILNSTGNELYTVGVIEVKRRCPNAFHHTPGIQSVVLSDDERLFVASALINNKSDKYGDRHKGKE